MYKAKNPKISCILNSFNKPPLFADAVESVLNQSYQDFELIIMDGGSKKDGMDKLLKKYAKHPKIRIYFTGETEKDRKTKIMHSVAMNMGIKLAKGEYITYLCDDDIYYPSRFEKMIEKFQSKPDIDIVYCWLNLCNLSLNGKKANFHVRKVWGLRGKKANPPLPLDTYVDGIAFMHRKSCLKKLKKPYWPEGPKDQQWHYDGLFEEKLGEYSIFYPIEEVLYEHRFTPLSTNYGFLPKWRIFCQMLLGYLLPNKKFGVYFIKKLQ